MPLPDGSVALIDAADLSIVSPHPWHVVKKKGGRKYVAGTVHGKNIYLHRYLMSPTREQEVDHRNRDGLDNQRHNLRIATSSLNQHNRTPWGKSKYRGVAFVTRSGKWRARIKVEKQTYYLGSFKTEQEAADAYDTAAIRLRGVEACPNTPRTIQELGFADAREAQQTLLAAFVSVTAPSPSPRATSRKGGGK